MQQVCTKCKTSKELIEDNFETQAPGQFNSMCRECRSQYYKDWRAKKDPEYLRRKALKELYNTTVEWYENKLKYQGGHCALCEATQFTHRKRMGVDHDHSCCLKKGCGKCNRGILCATCNYRVGQLEAVLQEAQVIPLSDSWTEKAMLYVDSYKILAQRP